MQAVVSPVIVGRDEEISVVEDALLAANTGEGRLIAIGGEAGVGKTRLVTELGRRARKLGMELLWGSCADTEVSLPYLPFMEAIGNYLSRSNVSDVILRLGPSAGELAQLFPQLGSVTREGTVGDALHAKARLFEAVASMLSLPAFDAGVLVVVDDAHWADASTRELLDHLTRRIRSMRALLAVTYRSDEIDRRHPLLPLLQNWRRSHLAETVKLEPLTRDGVAETIGAIFDEREVSHELRDLMYERSEGNPFVLEEMLKEAIDRGDIFRSKDGWDRKPVESFRIPDSVRDTILLRVSRLDPAHVAILECASVVGRSFDLATLSAVADTTDAAVLDALAAATATQLIEEDPRSPGRLRWRHALVQEAISGDILVTRRELLHSRAADALAGSARAVERAHHLMDAARFAEAVPECLRAAEEAEAALAYTDAITLYERALPHITDAHERGETLCRLGQDYGWDERNHLAVTALGDGIAELENTNDPVRAAHFRLWLGRNQWVIGAPDGGDGEYEKARAVLEALGPSADLAMAYLRLAASRTFALDHRGAREGAERAYRIAEAAGADLERVWALGWLSTVLVQSGEIERGIAGSDQVYEEAMERGFVFVAHNTQWNDCWDRIHTMIPGADGCVRRLFNAQILLGWRGWSLLARSYVRLASGELAGALADTDESLSLIGGNPKSEWRNRIQAGEVLCEMGRVSEAMGRLPEPGDKADAQDLVYQAPAQIRTRMASGRLDDAAAYARLVHAHRHRLGGFRETLVVAAEALLAAGLVAEAEDLAAAGHDDPTPAGTPYLRQLEAMIALAKGDGTAALAAVRGAAEEAERCGFSLAATRIRLVLARAASAAGDVALAEESFRRLVLDADRMGANLIGNEARAEAATIGLDLPAAPDQGTEEREIPVGERVITSLFADVRGFTPMSVGSSPEVMVDRMTSLYRWGKNEVERNRGMIDKFAGDAVMATFNAAGTAVDHPLQAVKAALGLRDKAALMDLPIGIGIAAGPAVVGTAVRGANPMTLGPTVNLAARLQTAASAGEIVLNEEVHRRTTAWLAERGIEAERVELDLKGFEGPQIAYRIRAVAEVSAVAAG